MYSNFPEENKVMIWFSNLTSHGHPQNLSSIESNLV